MSSSPFRRKLVLFLAFGSALILLSGCKVTIEKPSNNASFAEGVAVHFKAEYNGTGNIQWESRHTAPNGVQATLGNSFFSSNATGVGRKGYPWDFTISALPRGTHRIKAFKNNDATEITIRITGFCERPDTNCSHLDNGCVRGVCDPILDRCAEEVLPDGADCEGQFVCTDQGLCRNGKCYAMPAVCLTDDDLDAWLSLAPGETQSPPIVKIENHYQSDDKIERVTVEFQLKGLYYSVKRREGVTQVGISVPDFTNGEIEIDSIALPRRSIEFAVDPNWDRVAVEVERMETIFLGSIPIQESMVINPPLRGGAAEDYLDLTGVSGSIPASYFSPEQIARTIEGFVNVGRIELFPVVLQVGSNEVGVSVLTNLKVSFTPTTFKNVEDLSVSSNNLELYLPRYPNLDITKWLESGLVRTAPGHYYIVVGRDADTGEWYDSVGSIVDGDENVLSNLGEFIDLKESQGYLVQVHRLEDIGIDLGSDTRMATQCKLQSAIIEMSEFAEANGSRLEHVLLVGNDVPMFLNEGSGSYFGLADFQVLAEDNGEFETAYPENRPNYSGYTEAFLPAIPGNSTANLKVTFGGAIEGVFISNHIGADCINRKAGQDLYGPYQHHPVIIENDCNSYAGHKISVKFSSNSDSTSRPWLYVTRTDDGEEFPIEEVFDSSRNQEPNPLLQANLFVTEEDPLTMDHNGITVKQGEAPTHRIQYPMEYLLQQADRLGGRHWSDGDRSDLPYTRATLSPICEKYLSGWIPEGDSVCQNGEIACTNSVEWGTGRGGKYVRVCKDGQYGPYMGVRQFLRDNNLTGSGFCSGGQIYLRYPRQQYPEPSQRFADPWETLNKRAIGRIAASTAVEMGHHLRKIIRQQTDASWRYEKQIFISGTELNTTSGPSLNDKYDNMLHQTRIQRFLYLSYQAHERYRNFSAMHLETAFLGEHPPRSGVLREKLVDRGYGLVLYLGHEMDFLDRFQNSDDGSNDGFETKANGIHPVMFADSCSSITSAGVELTSRHIGGVSNYIGFIKGIGDDQHGPFLEYVLRSHVASPRLSFAVRSTVEDSMMNDLLRETYYMVTLGDTSARIRLNRDSDGDGVPNSFDTCPFHHNPENASCDWDRQLTECLKSAYVELGLALKHNHDGLLEMGDCKEALDDPIRWQCDKDVVQLVCRDIVRAPMCDIVSSKDESCDLYGCYMESHVPDYRCSHVYEAKPTVEILDGGAAAYGNSLVLDQVLLSASKNYYNLIKLREGYCVCEYPGGRNCRTQCPGDLDTIDLTWRKSSTGWQPVGDFISGSAFKRCGSWGGRVENRHVCNDPNRVKEQITVCNEPDSFFISERQLSPGTVNPFRKWTYKQWNWMEELLPKDFYNLEKTCRLPASAPLSSLPYDFNFRYFVMPQGGGIGSPTDLDKHTVSDAFEVRRRVRDVLWPGSDTFLPSALTILSTGLDGENASISTGHAVAYQIEGDGRSRSWRKGEPSGLVMNALSNAGDSMVMQRDPVLFGTNSLPSVQGISEYRSAAGYLKAVRFPLRTQGHSQPAFLVFQEGDQNSTLVHLISQDEQDRPVLRHLGRLPERTEETSFHWDAMTRVFWAFNLDAGEVPRVWNLSLTDLENKSLPHRWRRVFVGASTGSVPSGPYRMVTTDEKATRLEFVSSGGSGAASYEFDIQSQRFVHRDVMEVDGDEVCSLRLTGQSAYKVFSTSRDIIVEEISSSDKLRYRASNVTKGQIRGCLILPDQISSKVSVMYTDGEGLQILRFVNVPNRNTGGPHQVGWELQGSALSVYLSESR